MGWGVLGTRLRGWWLLRERALKKSVSRTQKGISHWRARWDELMP
jgi:hypothetical protein